MIELGKRLWRWQHRIHRALTPRRRLPIIVGGFYRSGTTLVRRLLDSHSAIHCGPEIKFLQDWNGMVLDDACNHLRFFRTLRTLDLPRKENLRRFGGAFVGAHKSAARRAGKRRWADKAPENALLIDQWRIILPGGFLFVHVVRNPLDALASARRKFPHTIPADFRDTVLFYKRFREAAETFERRYPKRALRVRYEELVADPQPQLERLFRFLGEENETGLAGRFNSPERRRGMEDSKVGKTSAIHQDSVGRWRRDLGPDQVAIARGLLPAAWLAESDRVASPAVVPEAQSC